MLTCANASFEQWFAELERLAQKLGAKCWPDEDYYLADFGRGLTPNEALRLDGGGEEEG